MPTHADRILDFVRRFPGRDDDEIAKALGIQPRQTVNLNCRRLEQRGYIERRPGSTGKVGNFLPGSRRDVAPAAMVSATGALEAVTALPRRPLLTAERLLAAGFKIAGEWVIADGRIRTSQPMPKGRGVYAFVIDGSAVYVGLATMGLARRLHFYARPGSTQTTSLRLNALLGEMAAAGGRVEIYIAEPPNLSWNGLPVSGDAGLELGLIEAFELIWNKRGVR